MEGCVTICPVEGTKTTKITWCLWCSYKIGKIFSYAICLKEESSSNLRWFRYFKPDVTLQQCANGTPSPELLAFAGRIAGPRYTNAKQHTQYGKVVQEKVYDFFYYEPPWSWRCPSNPPGVFFCGSLWSTKKEHINDRVSGRHKSLDLVRASGLQPAGAGIPQGSGQRELWKLM